MQNLNYCIIEGWGNHGCVYNYVVLFRFCVLVQILSSKVHIYLSKLSFFHIKSIIPCKAKYEGLKLFNTTAILANRPPDVHLGNKLVKTLPERA